MQNYLKYLALLFLVVGTNISCNDDEFVQYADGQDVSIADSYLQILTAVIPFQGGIPDYTYSFNYLRGVKKVTKVNAYSTFSDPKTGLSSNEVLLNSFTVGADNISRIDQKITYEDLKKGLIVGGNPLPAVDSDINIGASWKLRFEGVLESGEVVQMKGNVIIAVLSVYAGLYKVVESSYYRIGVFSTSWNGQERFIGSVDADTYSYNDYWGNFAWTGNSFNFDIDELTGKIECPILVDGNIFSGSRPMTCKDDANLFASDPVFKCPDFNILIKDPSNPNSSQGKHKIKIIYGYFTNGSGPREFYEVLEKI